VQSYLDNESVQDKFLALLQAHKRTHNFTTYLMTHMKEERVKDINDLVKVLELGKKLREEFMAGNNPLIGQFMMKEMPEITFERFHGINQIEY